MANPVGRFWQLEDRGDGRGDMLTVSAPEWVNNGPIVFTEAAGATYDLNQDLSEPADSIAVVSGTLPIGITLDEQTGVLTYDGVGVPDIQSDVVFAANFGSAPTEYTIPTYSEENAAYTNFGMLRTNVQHSYLGDNFNGNLNTWSQPITNGQNPSSGNFIHDTSEGDFLWIAFHGWKRHIGQQSTAENAWQLRAADYAAWFKTGWIDSQSWNDDVNSNYDHIYGWGLCDWYEDQNDLDALPVIDTAIQRVSAHFAGTNPGDNIMTTSGSGGRRWARQLRFAVRAAQVSPNATNIAWRDKVIDIHLQTPEWNETYGMYFLGNGGSGDGITDNRTFPGAYDSGIRICINFHIGFWMQAVWFAWIDAEARGDTRAAELRRRLEKMAAFWRDLPFNAQGYWNLNCGYNINDGTPYQTGNGNPAEVYTICPINGLTFGYKLTGDVAMLNKAIAALKAWQKVRYENFNGGDGTNQLNHFVDSRSSGTYNLAYNNGEMQYTYALFENGGNPALV